jgi:hypothetical protein
MSGRSAPVRGGVNPAAAIPWGATGGIYDGCRFDRKAGSWKHVRETAVQLRRLVGYAGGACFSAPTDYAAIGFVATRS